MDLYISLFVALLLAALATITKYFGDEPLIAGYNTSSPAERKYMREKGIAAFMGNYVYLLAAVIIAGYLIKKAGFIWGIELSWALFLVLIILMLIRSRRFNPPPSLSSPRSAGIKKFSLWTGVIITLAVAGLITWAILPPQYHLGDEQIIITGAYGLNIKYNDIDEIVLQAEMPAVSMKNNGLNMGPILRGHFTVQEIGDARLFLRSHHAPVLIISFKDHPQPVLINFFDREETKQLYQQLKARLR